MAGAKLDGVVEAVRYTPDGRIAAVRAYERRGAVWSDHVLLDRKTLLERLRQGRRFAVGRRKPFLGGQFEVGKPMRLSGEWIITEGQAAARDILAGVPIF